MLGRAGYQPWRPQLRTCNHDDIVPGWVKTDSIESHNYFRRPGVTKEVSGDDHVGGVAQDSLQGASLACCLEHLGVVLSNQTLICKSAPRRYRRRLQASQDGRSGRPQRRQGWAP